MKNNMSFWKFSHTHQLTGKCWNINEGICTVRMPANGVW